MASSGASDDRLNLAHSGACSKMLTKQGSNFPEPERVMLSDMVVKINRKGKEQDRAMLITDKAVYNLMPGDYSKCKRRIELDQIASVTLSTSSDEFAIHIPEEYDYRFKSPNKERIAAVMRDVYAAKQGQRMPVSRISQSSLLAVTVTKDVARLQTREERLKRYRELLNQATNSDDEELNPGNETRPLDDDGKSGDGFADDSSIRPEDFEFLKVLGRGSFGKVMQVRKKDSGEVFAMKILKKSAIIARNQVEHTRAERQILQSLQHPFLMHLRYAFQTEGKLYFVLDYYRGGELFFHLKKRRRFNEDEARIFVAEVGMALGHLHSLDVIYRDLKPENILLDNDGHICLTDFGLSKELEQDDQAHTFCGTPEYLAPEIVMNLGHGKAVDWWSLGILLYELTVGIPPFYSQNVNEMYRKIQEAPLLFPPNLSAHCKDLIKQLLERDPSQRLGAGPNDFADIRAHAFFARLDWDALYRKEVDPPYKPNVRSETDTSNFDKQFTNEPVVDSFVPSTGAIGGDEFVDFTFGGGRGTALH